MALWRLLLVLFALVALVAGQAGDEQAAPVEEQQAAAPEQAGAEAAAEGGEGGEQEAGGAPKQLSEEEQKQQQKLQSLYMKYLGRHLSEPCQLLLQTLLSSPPEERAEKEKDFAPGSTCGDETRAVRACARPRRPTPPPPTASPHALVPLPFTCACPAAREGLWREAAEGAVGEGDPGPRQEAPRSQQAAAPHAHARALL